MLSEQTYIKTSNEFGVSVGVATILGYKHLKDSIKEVEKNTYKKMNSELSVNKMITDCIEDGLYHQLQRELYRLRSKSKRKISDLTIYKQAIKNIRNDSNTKPKPKKILTNR